MGLRGGTHAAVSYAIRDGRLPGSAKRVGASGWDIDAELADQEWAGNAHKTVRSSVVPGVEPFAAPPLPQPAAPPRRRRQPDDMGGPVPNLIHSEAWKRGAEASLKMMEVKQRQGILLEASRIKPLIFQRHRQIRDAVQNIPSRVVDAIAATIGDLDTDKRHKIRAIIATECRRVMEDLAKNPLRFDTDEVS